MFNTHSSLNIFNFINSKVSPSGDNSAELNAIRSFLFKNYIKTVYEKVDDNNDGFRVMFIANRFKSDFSNPISAECNGAIFYFDKTKKSFTPLVVPTELFNSKKLVKKNIESLYKAGGYEVFPVMDGTIMNLYYFNGSWRISTNKAYDATDLIMTGNKTYLDILNETLSYEHNKEIRDYLSIANMDINKCYTVCVKNSSFHSFVENHSSRSIFLANRVTLIQEVQMREVVNGQLGNYCFSVRKFNAISPAEFMSWKSLNQEVNESISKYKKLHNHTGFTPFLGVILRLKKNMKDGRTLEYSNILIESNLMSKVRNFLYNFNFSKNLSYKDNLTHNSCNADTEEMETEDISVYKNYYDMSTVNRLNIFLSRKDVQLFLSLMPQFREEFSSYNNFIIYITNVVMAFNKSVNMSAEEWAQCFNNITKHQILSEDDLNIFKKEELSKFQSNQMTPKQYTYVFKIVAAIMCDLNSKKININIHDGWNIVNDFIHSSKYLDYYYYYMYKI